MQFFSFSTWLLSNWNLVTDEIHENIELSVSKRRWIGLFRLRSLGILERKSLGFIPYNFPNMEFGTRDTLNIGLLIFGLIVGILEENFLCGLFCLCLVLGINHCWVFFWEFLVHFVGLTLLNFDNFFRLFFFGIGVQIPTALLWWKLKNTFTKNKSLGLTFQKALTFVDKLFGFSLFSGLTVGLLGRKCEAFLWYHFPNGGFWTKGTFGLTFFGLIKSFTTLKIAREAS